MFNLKTLTAALLCCFFYCCPVYGQLVDYATARRDAIENSRPLVVIIVASWCGPCQRMKSQDFTKVNAAVTYLDIDKDKSLASKIRRLYVVPEIVVYNQPKPGQWAVRRFKGYHPIGDIVK